jgi:hypothetical protein
MILAKRRWEKEENKLRNKMYEVEENAVPKMESEKKEKWKTNEKKKKGKQIRIFLSYLCLTCSQKLDAHKNCLLPNDFGSHKVGLQNSLPSRYFCFCTSLP